MKKRDEEFDGDIHNYMESFEKIKKEMFITYQGCLLERSGLDTFKWNGHEGSLDFIGGKIREARLEAKRSIGRLK